MINRYHFLITGVVQGVGFRPTVYRVAQELNLTGWVYNDAKGVTVEVQGEHADKFIESLKEALPRLAQIDHVDTRELPLVETEKNFRIVKTQNEDRVGAKISPDVAICPDCLSELFDPKGRFYLYPFLNCTNCGPRLTITRQLPYDRAQTAMSVFPMCPTCQSEYDDPLDRRYHAQPTACEKCGPELSASIDEIAETIQDGKIVALKGVGGYQLICDATNEATIKKLRERKARDAKPFAMMVLNAASAARHVIFDESEKNVLESWQRPILLLRKQNKAQAIAPSVVDGLVEYGMMLPCAPLHYLLFHALLHRPKGTKWLNAPSEIVLIATSANISGEPLITDDAVAQKELGNIADLIVSYNRKIVTRADDSVVRVVESVPYFIRRARGYVPKAIKLATEVPPTLGVGALLKNTVTITRGNEAFVSQYLGDMDNVETIDFFHETLNHLLHMLDVKPERVVHDLHPDFYTTKFAHGFGVPTIGVQHHAAHLLAVAAEHQLAEPAIGLALDGYGYGDEGEMWGGELMRVENRQTKRLAGLLPLPQPGGDIASKEPWRMAVATLYFMKEFDEIKKRFGHYAQTQGILKLLEKGLNIGLTSSGGRLFDIASALLGVRFVNRYEGEAPMQLEALVTEPTIVSNGWSIESGELSFIPLLKKLLSCNTEQGANLFHGTLIAGFADWLAQHAEAQHVKTILLSGGCFLNRVLIEGLITALREKGLTPLIHRQVPPNDGCISLGQIWIAD